MTDRNFSPEGRLSRRTLWIINTLGSMVLVFIFILMVMTAISQQEVISRIKSEQINLGYGAALAVQEEARKQQQKLDAVAEREQEHIAAFRAAQDEYRASGRVFDDAWENFLPFLQRLASAQTCSITLVPDASVPARVRALNEYNDCRAERGASRPILAAQEAADQFIRALETHREKYRAFAGAEDRLKNVRSDVEANRLSDVQQKVRDSFQDMEVLLSGWLLFGGGLVELPPAMLQILLTFVSGLFGAVLVTLVLLVYPKDVLDVTDTKETWARIFLGGLIALCVYIVLLGGAAILGTNTGIIAAGTNYMAFCGIGILAGMFSDRVAGWLSDRADTFFRRGEGEPHRAEPANG